MVTLLANQLLDKQPYTMTINPNNKTNSHTTNDYYSLWQQQYTIEITLLK